MAKVRCPLSGEEIKVERSRNDEDGDRWICRDCGADITLQTDRRLYHAAGKWIRCPGNDADVYTFVFTEEDGDYECDGCDGTITVHDGRLEHEAVALVNCPAFEDETSLVFLADEADWECDYCSAAIYVRKGEARHEEIEEITCTEYPDKVVIVPLEEDGAFECPYCGVEIEVNDGEAVHSAESTTPNECDDDNPAGNRSETGTKSGPRDRPFAKTEMDYARVLGLSGKTRIADIKRAYREQIRLYHPDTVANSGEKIRNVAEETSKEINEAFEFFRRNYDLS